MWMSLLWGRVGVVATGEMERMTEMKARASCGGYVLVNCGVNVNESVSVTLI